MDLLSTSLFFSALSFFLRLGQQGAIVEARGREVLQGDLRQADFLPHSSSFFLP
jgi:hypothetical protein